MRAEVSVLPVLAISPQGILDFIISGVALSIRIIVATCKCSTNMKSILVGVFLQNVKKKIIGPTAAERRYAMAMAEAEAKAKAKAEAEAMAKAEAEAEAKAEAKAKAEAEAKELEGELSADYPTFLKTMSQRSPTAFSLVIWHVN